ncbi:protein phosphatase 2C 51-like [Papaver somniferum]|uniref:protein phosphatase 2C 51-like n=1 Tax=Papaver somniferum TaxID=3469 RepID=UPI000E6F57D0|nr:protein phosphatase 2C 51-like [Papaver somniferum]
MEIIEDDHDHSNKMGGSSLPPIGILLEKDVPAAATTTTVGILVSSGGNELCGGGCDDDISRDILQCVSHGSVSVCGGRPEMEDAVTIVQNLLPSSNNVRPRNHDHGGEVKYDFFGVYDGHGGSVVANLCCERLHKILVTETVSSNLDGIEWENVMVSCFEKMDREVSEKEVEIKSIKSQGSTAVVSLISKDKIIVANCGDSRAVLSRAGSPPIPLSQDHKPDRKDEMERIEAAGGTVINWNGFRVLGVLATSRCIGDRYLKPFVTSVPEVTITSRNESDEFLIFASDGLWDVMSNKMACQIARKCLEGKVARISSSLLDHTCNAAFAAAVLAEVAMARGSKDNISVVIVELKKLIQVDG